MLKIAICDDDKSTHTRLSELLLNYSVRCNQDFDVQHFYKAEELLEAPFDYNILFLDIMLDDSNDGINVGKKLRIPLSTRRNYQSEGYGIKNIITSLIKYSGHLSLQHTDDEFCAIIRMEIKSTDDSWRQG